LALLNFNFKNAWSKLQKKKKSSQDVDRKPKRRRTGRPKQKWLEDADKDIQENEVERQQQ
jgi:hypothetical protein